MIADSIINALREQGVITSNPGTRVKIKLCQPRNQIDKRFYIVTQEEADIYDKYIFVKQFRLDLSLKKLCEEKEWFE